MKKTLIVMLICFFPIIGSTKTIELTKSDVITFSISAYVHGFKEFDTSVIGFDESVSIGIYYDTTTQNKSRAEMLAKRFRKQVPLILAKYKWAKKVKVIVNVYGEEKTERGY